MAFTTMALIGLAAAGGLAAGSMMSGNADPNAVTGRRAAPGATPAGTPADPMGASQSTSNATVAAKQAADKQRKRAAAGSTLLANAPGTPGGKTMTPAVLQQRTLVGGSY
jgi:hypothetical protein